MSDPRDPSTILPPAPASATQADALRSILERAVSEADLASRDPSLRGALPKPVAAELLFSLHRALRG